ncbi:MAG: regulator [Planctomycetota bacterium]|nr:MAG: regulator [Planctomycetota bacterium]
MARDKDVLTTGDVARCCRVTIRTVIKWFDQGRLEGYRLPGSGDRRFTRAAVERFMLKNELPTDLLHGDAGPRRVLVVDDDQGVLEMIKRVLTRLPDIEISTASSGWEAGMQTASVHPHMILLDYRLGDMTGDTVVATIRSHTELPSQPAIVIMSAFLTDDEAAQLLRDGADAYLAKPFDLDELRATVRRYAGLPA